MLATDGVERHGDVERRAGPRPLEQQVLEEVRRAEVRRRAGCSADSGTGGRLVAGARGDPEADGRAARPGTASLRIRTPLGRTDRRTREPPAAPMVVSGCSRGSATPLLIRPSVGHAGAGRPALSREGRASAARALEGGEVPSSRSSETARTSASTSDAFQDRRSPRPAAGARGARRGRRRRDRRRASVPIASRAARTRRPRRPAWTSARFPSGSRLSSLLLRATPRRKPCASGAVETSERP